MPTDPEDMDSVEIPEPLFASFHEGGGYTLSNDEVGITDEHDGYLSGVVQEIRNNAGQDGDSRLYTLRLEGVDRRVMFYGRADIDDKVDHAAIGAGDEVAILRTGEEVDVGQESPKHEFDVRVLKA